MPDNKRVLILTADAGFGHRSAANAIAEALQETHGDECTYDIVNVLDDEHTPQLLRDSQSDYDRIAREMPDVYKFAYEATDSNAPAAIMDRGLQAMLYNPMRQVLNDKQPDVIISTYPLYQAPLGAVFSLTKKFIPLVTVVTDLVTVHQIWFSSYPDLTIVPTEAVRDLAVRAKIPAEQIEVIGIPVHPRLSQETRDKAAIRAELGWDPTLATLLIMGSKRGNLYIDVAHVLNHSGLPVQLIVTTGGDEKHYAELQKAVWHRPAHVYNLVKNMPTMMRAADAVVCKAGGLTVTESLACGLPLMLTDVIPGQETGNAEYVVNGGAGEIIDAPLKALETVCHWLLNDGQLLKERSINAAKLGRPRAAYDIVDRTWALMQRGPIEKKAGQVLLLPRLIEMFQRFGVKVEEG
ncbi:MAG TPA: glycosyltransferase [Anaerolineae bacterium]|nr:glycosyltransferase [Anaerolineae bacterium]